MMATSNLDLHARKRKLADTTTHNSAKLILVLLVIYIIHCGSVVSPSTCVCLCVCVLCIHTDMRVCLITSDKHS